MTRERRIINVVNQWASLHPHANELVVETSRGELSLREFAKELELHTPTGKHFLRTLQHMGNLLSLHEALEMFTSQKRQPVSNVR